MGEYLVLRVHLHRRICRDFPRAPSISSPIIPPPPAVAAGANSGAPLPRHGVNFVNNLRRNPPVHGGGDPRYALVLAPLENHAVPVAPLFSLRHAPLRARVLLVIRVLPLPFPPYSPDVLHDSPAPATLGVPALQPLHPHLHVLPLARILAVLPGPRHSPNNLGLFRGLRVPFLDRDWAPQRVLPIRHQLPDCPPRL